MRRLTAAAYLVLALLPHVALHIRSRATRDMHLHKLIALLPHIVAAHCYRALLPRVVTARWYRALVPRVGTARGNRALVPHIVTARGTNAAVTTRKEKLTTRVNNGS